MSVCFGLVLPVTFDARRARTVGGSAPYQVRQPAVRMRDRQPSLVVVALVSSLCVACCESENASTYIIMQIKVI